MESTSAVLTSDLHPHDSPISWSLQYKVPRLRPLQGALKVPTVLKFKQDQYSKFSFCKSGGIALQEPVLQMMQAD